MNKATDITQGKQANIAAIEAAKNALAPIEEDKTQRLSVSHATLVGAITSAALSRKFALQMELASGCALFMSMGDTNKDAKLALMSIYAEAGYECADMHGADYKTISRRINATAKLFDYIGYETIDSWCAGTSDMLTVNTIVARIEPMALKSINATLAFVGKPVLPKPVSGESEQTDKLPEQHTVSAKGMPEGQLPEQLTADQKYEEWLSRRGKTPLEQDWQIEAGFKKLETEHITASISPDATKDEIVKIAMQLLEFANSMEAQDADTRGISEGEYHEPEPGDDIGNIHPSNPKREVAGNVAVKETVLVDADGNVPPKPRASRYRAAPKK